MAYFLIFHKSVLILNTTFNFKNVLLCCISGPKNTHFTLYGNIEKGNGPSFIDAARPEQATAIYDELMKI